MKNILLSLMIFLSVNIFDINTLNSTAAVLIDGNSGRVLVGKNENQILANASTTKILTCILAIENSDMQDVVTVSKYASTMPDVQLNIREGQQFYMSDLLYSLMLESHNDSAVAIAEHIAGSVEGFADMMNEKARELGCYNTNFVTPNGLDNENENGMHSTTAYDLTLIMKYCINNDKFLEITQAASHSFTDIEGKSSYSVNNKNALLREGIGVISGKTGFTGKAGYCYVGACKDGDRTYIFSLLACGWPPAKNKKWLDSRALIKYGKENYELIKYKDIEIDKKKLKNITVNDGVEDDIEINIDEVGDKSILLNKDEKIAIAYHIPKVIEAPIRKGDVIGRIDYMLEGKIYHSVPVYSNQNVEKKDYSWCLENVLNKVLFN